MTALSEHMMFAVRGDLGFVILTHSRMMSLGLSAENDHRNRDLRKQLGTVCMALVRMQGKSNPRRRFADLLPYHLHLFL